MNAPTNEHALPTLPEAIEALHRVEKRYDEGERIRQTRAALEANERFATDTGRVETYYAHQTEKDMFRPIYGLGNTANGIPMALPPYVIRIMDASARILYALVREQLRERGPQMLLDRVTPGWLSDEMAARLHGYYLTTEPDLAFDVLVFGRNSRRGMTFAEFKDSNDQLDVRILEAQSVDTYFGWFHEYLKGARLAGLGPECRFTDAEGPDGHKLSDAGLDAQVLGTLAHGTQDDPAKILFLEITPEKQPSYQNLVFMSDLLSGGRSERRPSILDPRDLAVEGDTLWAVADGKRREIRKVISRIVEADLKPYVEGLIAEGKGDVVERLKKIYALPRLWPDLSKHLAGFYLIDKSSITDLCLLGEVGIAPKTHILTAADLEAFRKDPAALKGIAIKPLHGMSAKGVIVEPTLEEVEKTMTAEKMLQQEIIWATPVMPNINPEIADPDVQAGICSEARLVLHAGSPSVAHRPNRARLIAALSRSHYTSRDPGRKIKNDAKNRGWFSNVGAIMMVKVELGLQTKNNAGLGMAPIYWLE